MTPLYFHVTASITPASRRLFNPEANAGSRYEVTRSSSSKCPRVETHRHLPGPGFALHHFFSRLFACRPQQQHDVAQHWPSPLPPFRHQEINSERAYVLMFRIGNEPRQTMPHSPLALHHISRHGRTARSGERTGLPAARPRYALPRGSPDGGSLEVTMNVMPTYSSTAGTSPTASWRRAGETYPSPRRPHRSGSMSPCHRLPLRPGPMALS